jgi:hypothetical protein
MSMPADVVKTYIHAKDGNRPFLMKRAFAEDAELEIIVKTDAISFPSSAKGLSSIEDVLVRKFALDFENVFTFCLTEPPTKPCAHFACHWLVGMTARTNGQIRVGGGRYDWHFGADGRVEKLVIVIDVMKVHAADESSPSMTWLSALSYPWCSVEEAAKRMPATQQFAEIRTFLMEVRSRAPAA